jgi:MATE family multidrug resistance protein
MTFPEHIKKVLFLGLPLVGSHVAQFAIHVVDTIMLGWYSIEALAASVLGTSFFFVIFIMGAGFAFAVMPMVAEAAVKDDPVRIRRVTRMGMWLSVIYASVFLPFMIWSEPVLLALGQDPDLSQSAQEYLRIAGFGLFPALLVMALKNYLAALERTAPVLWLTVAGLFVNSGLNYMLIFGNLGAPEMGLRGAALASVLTQVLTLLAMAWYVAQAQGVKEHTIFVRFWKRDNEALGEVFRLGWPIGLTNLAESGMFSASALIIGLIGVIELAAHGIALQIAALTFMVFIGLSQAATVRSGNALGRGDWDGMVRGAWAVFALTMGMVLIAIALFFGIPEMLLTGFISPDEPNKAAILTVGVALLAIAAVFQLFDAGQVMFLGLLRGVQDTRAPMILAAISYWVIGIPASYYIGIELDQGAIGVWAGLVIGLAVATLFLGLRWRWKVAQLRAG